MHLAEHVPSGKGSLYWISQQDNQLYPRIKPKDPIGHKRIVEIFRRRLE